MGYNYSKQTNFRKEKVDLGEDYSQKVQENFKKRSTSDTTGDPLLISHHVFDQIKKHEK